MIKFFIGILISISLASCGNGKDAQIEKCVEAIMEAYKSGWVGKEKQLEVKARLDCLNAAAGGAKD